MAQDMGCLHDSNLEICPKAIYVQRAHSELARYITGHTQKYFHSIKAWNFTKRDAAEVKHKVACQLRRQDIAKALR